jgi:hypothetical protein
VRQLERLGQRVTMDRGIDAFNRRDADLIAGLTTPDFAWFSGMPSAIT